MKCSAVAVVGSLNVDFVVVVARLPRPGETVIDGTFERHWGGKGANQAVAASRYGAEVSFVGAVGDDDLGPQAVAALDDEGIDTREVTRCVGEATGVALIAVDQQGQNQIAVASGANLRVRTDKLRSLIDTHRTAGVVLAGFEVPDDAVVTAVRVAISAGWRAVVNPAPARSLDRRLYGCGAILTPNQHELSALTGIEDVVDGARRLVAHGTGGPVVVTLGQRGALLVTEDEVLEAPAPRVAARDTTGAGDVFNGVFAAALAEGQTLIDSLRIGVAAASYAVELPGARGQLRREGIHARLIGPRESRDEALGRGEDRSLKTQHRHHI
jgi:ribokinase